VTSAGTADTHDDQPSARVCGPVMFEHHTDEEVGLAAFDGGPGVLHQGADGGQGLRPVIPQLGEQRVHGDNPLMVGKGEARVDLPEQLRDPLPRRPKLVPRGQQPGGRGVLADPGVPTQRHHRPTRGRGAAPHQAPSNNRVTRSATGDLSERVSVTWANNDSPLSLSMTVAIPSCRPTRRLSRCARS